MAIAVNDLRVYSLSDASMFDMLFPQRTTFAGDWYLIAVFSFEFFANPTPVRLGSWA